MKIFAAALLSVACCVSLRAQEKSPLDSLKTISAQADSAMQAKEYGKAERFYARAIDFALSYDDQTIGQWRKGYTSVQGYYNLACIYVITGENGKAVDAYVRAVDAGDKYGFKVPWDDAQLAAISGYPQFVSAADRMKAKYDHVVMLRNCAPYDNSEPTDSLPCFTYLAQDDPRLVNLCKTLNLDSIAGRGDEISRIKNLCLWVHNTVRHDGNTPYSPQERNALFLLADAKEKNIGLNCRLLSTILNECYLAMGFKSRFVTCLPQDKNDPDCHVVNVVWSRTLGKWIMADPTNYAFFSDDKGVLLGIKEARERIIAGLPVRLNREANWNGQKTDEKNYLDYMSKNFYWFSCPFISTYDTETKGKRGNDYYLMLASPGFKPWSNDYLTHNSDYFWARPE